MKFDFQFTSDTQEVDVVPMDSLPAETPLVSVNFEPNSGLGRLFYWIAGSIILVFLITRLDAVTNDPGVREFIIALLNWGTLSTPFFPEHFWQPVTCAWFHGSFWHLGNNLIAMAMVTWWLRKAYKGNLWFLFFIVGTAISSTVHAMVLGSPAADFVHWTGNLDSIFHQPNTPLAGASGGIFAMWGAATAAAFRYALLKKRGVINRMGVGFLTLLVPALVQFWFLDRADAGIAGLAHQVGMLVGFVLGLLPAIKGNLYVHVSRTEPVKVRSFTTKGKAHAPSSLQFYLTEEFSSERDFVVVSEETIDAVGQRHRRPSQVLAGSLPDAKKLRGKRIADSNKLVGLEVFEASAFNN
jgi:membrane associated rhomboid family serine protease